MNPIYLDYNASTPIASEVAAAMRPYLNKYFGNPSSAHSFGNKPRLALENAREQVARLINCKPSEIVFTSGGTEANNYALKGYAFANLHKGNHIITSTIEHPSIIEVCKYLEKKGFSISYLPVDKYGMIRIADLEKEIRSETILISLMHANNEVGTVQPISKVASIAKKHNIPLHSDAAQSLGKIPVDVKEFQIDLLSIAGHKLYAPKGIGALYVKEGISLEKLMHGANHENNYRAGTENILEIVGLGEACNLAFEELENNMLHYRCCRNFLQKEIQDKIPSAIINGHPTHMLPNTLSISFPNINASMLIGRLKNIAISAGAACHSDAIHISSVLQAMKIPFDIAMGTIRISTGKYNTLDEMKLAATEIISNTKFLLDEKTNITPPENINCRR